MLGCGCTNSHQQVYREEGYPFCRGGLYAAVPSFHGIFQTRVLEWLPFPTLEDPLDPGIEPKSLVSSALQADSLPLNHQGSTILGKPLMPLTLPFAHL